MGWGWGGGGVGERVWRRQKLERSGNGICVPKFKFLQVEHLPLPFMHVGTVFA